MLFWFIDKGLDLKDKRDEGICILKCRSGGAAVEVNRGERGVRTRDFRERSSGEVEKFVRCLTKKKLLLYGVGLGVAFFVAEERVRSSCSSFKDIWRKVVLMGVRYGGKIERSRSGERRGSGGESVEVGSSMRR